MEIIKVINDWQTNDFVHPLTCGNDSQNHDHLILDLKGIGNEFELHLVCNNCDWKQDIPDFFIDNFKILGIDSVDDC